MQIHADITDPHLRRVAELFVRGLELLDADLYPARPAEASGSRPKPTSRPPAGRPLSRTERDRLTRACALPGVLVEKRNRRQERDTNAFEGEQKLSERERRVRRHLLRKAGYRSSES